MVEPQEIIEINGHYKLSAKYAEVISNLRNELADIKDNDQKVAEILMKQSGKVANDREFTALLIKYLKILLEKQLALPTCGDYMRELINQMSNLVDQAINEKQIDQDGFKNEELEFELLY